ncbi:MAG: ATP-binding cassette domain-containing protein [Dehalococcoidia bacterium]
MNTLAIEAKGLQKRYEKVLAVRGLDLAVKRGEIFGLVGADGAGKTTTIQMLCTLSLPSAGEARVLGMDTVKQAEGIKERIGYMSERFTLYPTLTVEENLDFFARLRHVPHELAEHRKKELLHFSRLGPFHNRLAEHLSGGMQKKLALCCSLIHQPEVIFLDEPTTGVDPISRRDFWRIVSRFLAQGITVFVSTAYLDEAERFSRVALMHQGKIIACDTPRRLKEEIAGELLEIRAEPVRKAVAALRKIPATSGAHIFGDSIHILVDKAEKRLPELKLLLDEKEVRLKDARQVAPSLEDVFVASLAELEEKPEVQSGVVSASPESPIEKYDHGEVAIGVSELERRFGDFTAVDHVSFEVRRGEIFGLLGPNGSGKTTTIRMLCGLLLPTSGRASVLGQDMAISPHNVRPKMGYMSQRVSLFRDLTVEENINLYGGLYGLPGSLLKERKEWVLEMAGLRGKEKSLAQELSGGWKQRLALGCTIIHSPEVVFLDEPTAGVDPLSRRFLWELIQELAARGTAILVTTHYMDEAERCHRLGLMHQGRLIAEGSPSQLRTERPRGELLEVVSSDFSRAVEVLSAQPAYRQVSFFGDTVHVVVDKATAASQAIKNLLEKNGIEVQGISQIPFAMEDVFISLVEEQSVSPSTQSSEKGHDRAATHL